MHISIDIDGNTTKEQLHGLSKAATALAEGAMSRDEFLTVQRGLYAGQAFSQGSVSSVGLIGGASLAAAPAVEATEEPATSERKPRGRGKKGENAAPVAEEAALSTSGTEGPAVAANPAPAAPQQESAPSVELTAQHVRDQLKTYVEKHGMEAATAKLAEMGFQMVSQIPADKFASAIEALAV